MSTLSVIVPIYNSELYIEECINSIVNQSFKNLEIILINDGSTDSSLQICNELAVKDSRIIVLDQENRGQSAARNRGLDIANGDFITFVDSDDSISLDLYERNINILNKDSKIDFIQFPYFQDYGMDYGYLKKNKEKKIEQKEDLYRNILTEKKISWVVWDKIF